MRPLLFAFLLSVSLGAFPQSKQASRNASTALEAETFPGADIGAKMQAALQSAAGAPSIRLTLAPGHTYSFSTPVTLPNSSTGTHRILMDCHGSSLKWTGGTKAIPITALGENANGPYDTGRIENCEIDGNGATATIRILGRLGFAVVHNSIANRSGNGVSIVNTNTAGGPGYSEDDVVSENTFNVSGHAIDIVRGPGGSDSIDYSWYENNHCEILTGSWCVYLGPGINAQGMRISMTLNTWNGGDKPGGGIFVDPGSGIARSWVDLRGEDTAGLGKNFWDIQGHVYVEGSTFVTGAHTGPDVVIAPPQQYVPVRAGGGTQVLRGMHMEDEIGAGGAPGRRSEIFVSPTLTLLGLRHYGEENRGEFHILQCDGNHDHALQSNCESSLYAGGSTGIGIGPGFGQFGGVSPARSYPLHLRTTSGNAMLLESTTPSAMLQMQNAGRKSVISIFTGLENRPFTLRDEVNHHDLGTDTAGNLLLPAQVATPAVTPSSSKASCLPNSISADDNFLYHCNREGNGYRRVPLTNF